MTSCEWNRKSINSATTPHLEKLRIWSKETVKARMHRWSDSVPPGWHDLLWRAFMQLEAVRTRERNGALQELTVKVADSALEISLPTNDIVLLGISRRVNQSSRFRCQDCGKRGRPRALGLERQQTLCPGCAAPKLLVADIDGLLKVATTRSWPTVWARDVPQLLRADFLELAGQPWQSSSADKDISMDRLQFAAWLESLVQIRRVLSAPQAPIVDLGNA